MNPKFRELVESLEPKYSALLSMAPVRFGSLPKEIPLRGIYLFSEGATHLYVGRTNGIRKRLQTTVDSAALISRPHLPFGLLGTRPAKRKRHMRRQVQEAHSVRMRSLVLRSRQRRNGSTRWTFASLRKATPSGRPFLKSTSHLVCRLPSTTSRITDRSAAKRVWGRRWAV